MSLRHVRIWVALLTLGLGFQDPALSDDTKRTISIAGQKIPALYVPDGTGVYNKALDLLLEGFDGAVDVKFLPSQRVIKSFRDQTHDCTFVATDTANDFIQKGKDSGRIDFIGPVNTIAIAAYTRKGLPNIEKAADLEGRLFASDVNVTDRLAKEHGLTPFIAVQDQEKMLTLLYRGRVEALIGFDYDTDILIKKLGYKNDIYKTSFVLMEFRDGFMCHVNDSTQDFLAHLRAKLETLTANNTLKDLLSQ